ncbi:MAG: hypothetical protein J0L61_01645 [Planctomycetes bacterium]|nr:hypothetical protein [Planctomycetota bacterium]
MQKFKKIILILGPLVLVASLAWAWFSGPKSPMADSLEFVNVVTGERTTYSLSKVYAIPMLTGDMKPFLFPIETNEQGQVILRERYRPALSDLIKKNRIPKDGLKVDLGTFVVAGD